VAVALATAPHRDDEEWWVGGRVAALCLVCVVAGGGRGRWPEMTAALLVSACGAPGRIVWERRLGKRLPSVHQSTASLPRPAHVVCTR